VPSVSVGVALGAFALYGVWTAVVAGRSEFGPFLSPFYSPKIAGVGGISPALLVLPIPLAFRASCYHYRKAYNRALFRHPAACARAEPGSRDYHGETRFPFTLNNLHRFALYLSVVVLGFLWVDAVESLSYRGHLYVGVGSLLMVTNVVLLTGYTFGCHSLRHLVGGGLDCYSRERCGGARRSAWHAVSALTVRHGRWAWSSLATVAAVDVYIRLLQHGVTDLHLGG
jgi:hypothetical protein